MNDSDVTQTPASPSPESPGAKARPSLVDQVHAAVESQPVLRSLALSGIFLFAILSVLYLARSLFIPLTFALMMWFVLRPTLRRLQRIGLPPTLAATLLLTALASAVTFGAVRLVDPVTSWVQRVPDALGEVERKTRALRRPVENVSAFAKQVERIARVDSSPQKTREVTVQKPGLLASAIEVTGGLVGGAVVVLLALYFMLIWGDGLLHGLIALVPDLRDQARASNVLNIIEGRMSAYLRTLFLINLLVGAAVGLSMHLLHMPNPVLWAVLAGTLNFVPYLGTLVGVATLGLASLVTFPDLQSAMLPPAAYFVLNAIEGNLITPVIMGRTFHTSPLLIFLWLLFWGWLWGVAGAIVAVPLLMLLKITCEQSETLAPLAELLKR